MADKKPEATQKTQPNKGEPNEILPPTREDVEDFIKGVSGHRSQGDEPKGKDQPSEG